MDVDGIETIGPVLTVGAVGVLPTAGGQRYQRDQRDPEDQSRTIASAVRYRLQAPSRPGSVIDNGTAPTSVWTPTRLSTVQRRHQRLSVGAAHQNAALFPTTPDLSRSP